MLEELQKLLSEERRAREKVETEKKAPAPPPECPMHAAEKNKAQATYQASAAEATECPVKHGVDPAAATTASGNPFTPVES